MSIILIIVFAGYFMQQQIEQQNNLVLQSAFNEAFRKVTWALALAWIIFCCNNGYGGPIEWFLSLAIWQPLARLSYAIYLVHLPILLVLSASIKHQSHFSDIDAVINFKFFKRYFQKVDSVTDI